MVFHSAQGFSRDGSARPIFIPFAFATTHRNTRCSPFVGAHCIYRRRRHAGHPPVVNRNADAKGWSDLSGALPTPRFTVDQRTVESLTAFTLRLNGSLLVFVMVSWPH